jgi:hypothetical protein
MTVLVHSHAVKATAPHGTDVHGTRSSSEEPRVPRGQWQSCNSGTVIRCLTIAVEDAVALNILELIMLGQRSRYLDEQIKQPTASPVGVEARP